VHNHIAREAVDIIDNDNVVASWFFTLQIGQHFTHAGPVQLTAGVIINKYLGNLKPAPARLFAAAGFLRG